MAMWRKLRTDEYILNDRVVRMTREKNMKIKSFDKSFLNEKRYA